MATFNAKAMHDLLNSGTVTADAAAAFAVELARLAHHAAEVANFSHEDVTRIGDAYEVASHAARKVSAKCDDRCMKCNGSGTVPFAIANGRCFSCNGTGKMFNKRCA